MKHIEVNQRVMYISASWIIKEVNKDNIVLISRCNKFESVVPRNNFKYIYPDTSYNLRKKIMYISE